MMLCRLYPCLGHMEETPLSTPGAERLRKARTPPPTAARESMEAAR